MRIKNDNLLTGLSDTDMTSNITSEAIWLGHIANYAIQIVFTGSPNGSFKLQASCDEPKKGDESNTEVVNWTDIANSTQDITAAGDHLYSVENAGYTFARIVWTNDSSGVSEITSARFMVKGV
jgi:hypothetical protein